MGFRDHQHKPKNPRKFSRKINRRTTVGAKIAGRHISEQVSEREFFRRACLWHYKNNALHTDLPRSRSKIDRDPDHDQKIDRRSDRLRLIGDRIGDQKK
ncbi:hypothetical protein OUZ56_017218 [Daphnia magna]|uniref:Uncharacterized protein n=1 Tax=Daphnia magna TaxID=35525 RepID=A0ABR0ASG8_9CRUS|nr:hypothetical protein OUZ56_017218 [Daphnia magna]